MLRYTLQHIFTLADVQYLAIDLDTVNAGMFVLGCKPPPAQHCTHILYIGCHGYLFEYYFSISTLLDFYKNYTKIFMKNQNRGIP